MILHKLLNAFGHRIQRSAFECVLTKEKCNILLKKIDIFAKKDDLIRIYRLNQNVKKIVYGDRLETENEDYYFI